MSRSMDCLQGRSFNSSKMCNLLQDTYSNFESRCKNHSMLFRRKSHTNYTELSKYLWCKRNENIRIDFNWSIGAHASPYKFRSYRCDLCLTEKFFIARSDPKLLLYNRAGLISKCRHRNKHVLSSVK